MQKKPWLWIGIIFIIIIALGIMGVILFKTTPLHVVSQYPLDVLAEEAGTMSACAECHETEKFHTCDTCHDDHGALELANVPFYAVVAFVGDVPEPGFVLLNDILPYQAQPHTHIPLLDFLADQGVTDFESVTLASVDEGFVTIRREDLTARALLMPYEDGIRFASEDLHISTWIKGIRRIIVVGHETPLVVDGQATSMGRLLLGPTQIVTVEQTDVMFKSDDDGQVRKAQTASRIEGALLASAVAHAEFSQVVLKDRDGQTHTLSAEEASNALLYQMRDAVVLVLPERGRSQWLTGVVEIVSE
jgi:hypothetical protein